jgi:transcription initiation factor TFIID subunit TAF12
MKGSEAIISYAVQGQDQSGRVVNGQDQRRSMNDGPENSDGQKRRDDIQADAPQNFHRLPSSRRIPRTVRHEDSGVRIIPHTQTDQERNVGVGVLKYTMRASKLE